MRGLVRVRARWVVLVAGVLALAVGALVLSGGFRDEVRLTPEWTLRPTDTLGLGAAGGRFSPVHLAAGPEVVVAVGRSEGSRTPGAWYSRDGVTWREGDLASRAVGPDRGAEVTGLVRYGGGFLAVGVITAGGTAQGEGEPAAWRSVDGRRWSRIESPPVSDDTGREVLGVHTDGDRAVVVASEEAMAVLEPRDDHWRRIELQLGGCGLRERTGLGPMPSALGVLCSEGQIGTRARAVLRLDGPAEGAPLVRVPGAEGVTPVAVGDGAVVVLVDRFVPSTPAGASTAAASLTRAVGRPDPHLQGKMRLCVSRSTDGGVHWTEPVPLPVPEGVETGSGRPTHLAWTGKGYLATGWAEGSMGAVPVSWSSADGAEWSAQQIDQYAVEWDLGSSVAFRDLHLVPAFYGPGQRTAGLLVSKDLPMPRVASPGPTGVSPPAGSPAPTGPGVPSGSPGASLAERMAGSWGGMVAVRTPGLGEAVRLRLRAVETASGPPRLAGRLTTEYCVINVVQREPAVEGALVLTPGDLSDADLDGPSCPELIELRLTEDGRLSWVDSFTAQGVLGPEPPD